MSQTTTTSTAPLGYVVSTMQAAIATLLTNMQAGKSISAADVRAINASVYDLWRTHSHNVSDLTGIDTFGNLRVYGADGTRITAPSSNLSLPAVTTPSGIATSSGITAADINVLINMVNSMRSHTHTITDTIGATYPQANLNFTFDETGGNYIIGIDSDGSAGGDYASMTFRPDGTLLTEHVGFFYYGRVQPNNWLTHSPVDSDTVAGYEVYATVTSTIGNAQWVAGTFNTWIPLTSTQQFKLQMVNPYDYGESIVHYDIRNTNTGSISVPLGDVHFLTGYQPADTTCFPADSNVLMADGTWKKIQFVQPGDVVMGMGKPVMVDKIDRPRLGLRKMKKFSDGSLLWSEEHAMWTRDSNKSQWWWAANPEMWRNEASAGAIGGLLDNSTIRADAAEWAHVDGWKSSTVVDDTSYAPSTQLFLPRTSGSPIIVNGYVVGAGVNQRGYDYTQLDWDAVLSTFPVVQPVPTV